MAGQTPNTTILKAIDQVIEALNDLAANFQPVKPPDLGTIETNIGRIGDEIATLNTTVETRSIAETVAQNTNFADLVAAIGQLSLVCAPEINVQSATPTINLSCPPPVINIQTGGGQTGIKLEDPPVSETDPPPVGQEPNPNIDNRKCKAANRIYDEIYLMIGKLKLQDADTLTGVGIVAATALIGALLGSGAPLIGNLIGAVFGAIVGIVIALVSGIAIDLDDIQTILSNKHQELVCALYNATDTTQAKNGFITVLQEGGLNSVEAIAFMGYFLYSDVLKVLFQAVGNSEALLDGYATSVGCDACSSDCYTFDENEQGFVLSSSGGGSIQWSNGALAVSLQDSQTSSAYAEKAIVDKPVARITATVAMSQDSGGVSLYAIYSDNSSEKIYYYEGGRPPNSNTIYIDVNTNAAKELVSIKFEFSHSYFWNQFTGTLDDVCVL